MSESKLSNDLEYWRDQRPSQWKMDEFIHKAKLLEDRLNEIEDKAMSGKNIAEGNVTAKG